MERDLQAWGAPPAGAGGGAAPRDALDAADAATRAEYVEARLGKLAESVAARVEQLHDEEDELAARRRPAEHRDLRHARVP